MNPSNETFPGSKLPAITLDTLDGDALSLDAAGWRVVVVYRGAHCPLCKAYLASLEGMKQDFIDADVELVALSADSAERARPFIEQSGFSMPVGVGLTVEHMQRLGLHVSDPRNADEAPAPFAEPALFVVRPDARVQIIDRANAPFLRPDMQGLLKGLKFVMANDYPIRGMHGLG